VIFRQPSIRRNLICPLATRVGPRWADGRARVSARCASEPAVLRALARPPRTDAGDRYRCAVQYARALGKTGVQRVGSGGPSSVSAAARQTA
jgi:hypothetical protein